MGRITLYGFYQYLPTLFDGMVLPDGMDKELLLDEILKESGDLYPYHQQPYKLQKNISNYFQRMLPQFERMYRALNLDYNPIENYDRYEELVETPNIRTETTGAGVSGSKASGSVAAYDRTELIDTSASTGNSDYSNQGTTVETGTRKHDNHIHGNIGVTMATQMIEAELNLRTMDLYAKIAAMFEKEFLVQIY